MGGLATATPTQSALPPPTSRMTPVRVAARARAAARPALLSEPAGAPAASSGAIAIVSALARARARARAGRAAAGRLRAESVPDAPGVPPWNLEIRQCLNHRTIPSGEHCPGLKAPAGGDRTSHPGVGLVLERHDAPAPQRLARPIHRRATRSGQQKVGMHWQGREPYAGESHNACRARTAAGLASSVFSATRWRASSSAPTRARWWSAAPPACGAIMPPLRKRRGRRRSGRSGRRKGRGRGRGGR